MTDVQARADEPLLLPVPGGSPVPVGPTDVTEPALLTESADRADSVGTAPDSDGIQPRGVLLVVRERDGEVLQVSTNCASLLHAEPGDVLGRPLADALGCGSASVVLDHLHRHIDLAARNPLVVSLDIGVAESLAEGVPPAETIPTGSALDVDVTLHRPPQSVVEDDAVAVLEIEPAAVAAAPLSFANSYVAVRRALGDLERASSLHDFLDAAAHHVRALTGFDHVVVYRFDGDATRVVAQSPQGGVAGRPATPAPSWGAAPSRDSGRVRLIADVRYTPVEIVPHDLPTTGRPLDLSDATLRTVAPADLASLRAAGVTAAMSISLVQGAQVWGVVDCYHYDGPRHPAHEVRAAAEFLASTLAVRLVARAEEEHDAELRRAAQAVARLVADSRDEDTPLGISLTRDDRLLRIVDADGAFVVADRRVDTVGTVPLTGGLRVLSRWLAGHSAQEVVAVDSLRATAPAVAAAVPTVDGLLGVVLPDGQAVVWLRETDGETPGASGAHGWSDDDVESASVLRGHLVEALYLRGRRDVRATEALQRSLLPSMLPEVPGWSLAARYEPAGRGFVGGDWYDALVLPSGRIALTVGDVTGHGLQAAAVMGQLRTTLRATLLGTPTVRDAATRLAEVMRWTMPDEVATLTVAILDPATGIVEHVTLGHPPLLVVEADGRSQWAFTASAPPLGLTFAVPEAQTLHVPEGAAMVLYSDGLVERRTESIRDGMARLAEVFSQGAAIDVDDVVRQVRDPDSADDATLLVVRREVSAWQ